MLQYAACVDDGVILLKNGSFLAGWRFISVDTDSSTHEELAFISDQANNAIKYLGDGWMIQVDAVRANADSYPRAGRAISRTGCRRPLRRNGGFISRAKETITPTENILYLTYRPSLTAEKLSRFAYEQTGQKQNKEPAAEKGASAFQRHSGAGRGRAVKHHAPGTPSRLHRRGRIRQRTQIFASAELHKACNQRRKNPPPLAHGPDVSRLSCRPPGSCRRHASANRSQIYRGRGY